MHPRFSLDWRLGGVLLGLLLTASVALWKPVGVSTAYPTTIGIAAEAFAPSWAAGNPYLRVVGTSLSEEVVEVIGIAIGAFAIAFLARRRRGAAEPPAGQWQGPGSRPRRYAVAFAGGFLLLFGARAAGGCTSGHVISGMSQLAVSGMVFAAGVFATGIPLALLLRRREVGV